MPISEYREIRFSATALRAALQARLAEANSRAAKGQEPPLAGTVVAATVARADPVQITVEIASPEGAQRGQVVMEAVRIGYEEAPVPGFPLHQIFLTDPLGQRIELTFSVG